MKLLFLILFLLSSLVIAQKPLPANEQTKPILIMGGIVHTGDGSVLQNGLIAFENGKLTLVADASLVKIDKSYYGEIINVSGKHIYPGFILPVTQLGLKEIDAVRATRDENETGSLNPNVRSIIAYNTDSKLIPTMKFNGILLAQTTPTGGVLMGTSSIVELDAWNWEDAVHKVDDGIHLNLPNYYSRTRKNGNWIFEKNESFVEEFEKLDLFFQEAKAYSKSINENVDLRFESMKGLFDGTQQLFLYADRAKDIYLGVDFAESLGIKKLILVGGADSWMLTDYLRNKDIPLIINSLQTLPSHSHSNISKRFELPKILNDAGVKFCFGGIGMELMEKRNLMFDAGIAVAYGLEYEKAVAALTSSTSEILGIDSSVGTLEKGKDATLIISSGDALDMKTNNIERAFIRGRDLDLNNEQKELYLRYAKKYNLDN